MGSWQVPVLPFIEMTGLRSIYYDYGVSGGRNYYDAANIAGATGQRVPLFQCPSDIPAADGWPGGASHVTYHNYVVNFGNTGVDETANWTVSTYNGLTFAGAPFTRGKPQALPKISDGTSGTLMISELVQGRGNDLRGNTWWSSGAGFVTSLRPNDSSPDLSWSNSAWCNPNLPNPPCAFRTTAFVFGARSRHFGGVNVVFCDGSGRFITDSILPATWQAMSTTSGGEPVAGDL